MEGHSHFQDIVPLNYFGCLPHCEMNYAQMSLFLFTDDKGHLDD